MRTKLWKRTCVAVLALALVAVLMPATMLAAATPATGDLYVHKYELDLSKAGTNGDGTEVTDIPSDAVALQGIVFTVSRVLPDENGIYPADAVTAKATTGAIDATFAPIVLPTDSTGVALFEDLPRGVYLVEETSSTVGGVTYAPVEDFLVAVPMTNEDGDGWLEQVHVYPKNQNMTPVKTADGGQFNPVLPTDTITWSITAPIPAGVEIFQDYSVLDQVDALLTVDVSSVAVYTVSSKTASADENTAANLVDPANYTQDLSVTNQLSITFDTTTGLELLAERATAGNAYLRVVFDTDLTDEALGLLIKNDATLDFTNKDGTEYTQDIPDNEQPMIYSGTIGITKYDEKEAVLAGATFKVAATKADALAGNFLKDVSGADIVGTSDEDGKLELRGIPYGAEGVAPDSDDYLEDGDHEITFWIVEVEAPQDYNLLVDPVEVTFAYSSAEDEDGNTINYFNNGVAIYNTRGFTLPRTGAAGILISTIAGSLLLSAVIVVIARRKLRKGSKA